MCGIAGLVQSNHGRIDEAALRRVAQVLHHRGPDGNGVWRDGRGQAALVHTRLAILDLSPHGRQPMHSPCGQFTIVYNGEVYNHLELRRQLQQFGHCFRGHSDTETILAAISHWGLENAISRFVGMFAFAVWDHRQRRLTLVRDRLGIKPLYYLPHGRRLLFGSELKALRAFPDWTPQIDRNALAQFLCRGYVPAPLTIYQDARKLPVGHLLHVSLQGDQLQIDSPQPFWSLADTIEKSKRQPAPNNEQEALEGLHERLAESVRCRLISDVPLGAFLSGGFDSTTIVALMQANSTAPVKTFTVGFDDQAYDESPYAAAIARRLGTDHHEIRIPECQLLNLIGDVPRIYDEPFGDESQLPTMLLSQFARRHVTVALSGDGGDELFGGYIRHAVASRLGPVWKRLPPALRKAAGRLLACAPPSTWDGVYSRVESLLTPGLRCSQAGDKLHKLAALLRCDGSLEFHDALARLWPQSPPVLGPFIDRPCSWQREPNARLTSAEQMMYIDTCAYLPDNVLTKVDRASMAAGLEARVPMLDHRVVEYVWSLPQHLKIRGGSGKLLLKKLLARVAPIEFRNRPKMGFSVPLAKWLRGPLREWASDLLSPAALERQGLLDAAEINRLWRTHLEGRGNAQYQLWSVLMFQAWRQQWIESNPQCEIAA